MAADCISFISESNPCDLYSTLLSDRKAYFDEICANKTDTAAKSSSFHAFCKLFYNLESNSSINDYTTSILDLYTKPFHLQNTPFQVSIASKIPIAQFIVDIYFHSVLKYNWSINEFMQKSNFLKCIPRDSRPWNIIRTHLSDYVKYIHHPINPQFVLNNYNAEEVRTKHDMTRILFYVKHIHENVFTLTHFCQIDLIFIPQKIPAINDEYFDNLCIEYQTLDNSQSNNIRHNTFWSMMRRFNDSLNKIDKNSAFINKTNADKRCVVLIMSDSDDIHQDIVYIFEDEKLSIDIIKHTEIPLIANSKSDLVLPILSCAKYDALNISIHRHKITDTYTERAYFQYKSYGTRVFKHNLQQVLKPFCSINERSRSQLQWNLEIEESEFNDSEYFAFIMSYFNDLALITPDLRHYFQVNNVKNRWSAILYRNMVRDTTQHYVYSAPTYLHLLHINDLINTYYETMGCNIKHDTFINYVHDNEFGDCDLNEMLIINPADECAICWFDDIFPIDLDIFEVTNDADRDRFSFYFVQHCYIFGSLPTKNYMLDKYMKS